MSEEELIKFLNDHEELNRLEDLQSPLLDLWLKFESAFVRLALDRYNISEEDADKLIMMLDHTAHSDTSKAYIHFIKRINPRRSIRKWLAKFQEDSDHDIIKALPGLIKTSSEN